mgnify:CR=1 FL=1
MQPKRPSIWLHDSIENASRKAGALQGIAWCDFRLAYRSRDALRAFLAIGPVVIQRQGVDRYGRTLALVTVNGRDAGQALVANGLARIWR